MYTAPVSTAGISVSTATIVNTSLVAPSGFSSTFWVCYVIAHLIVAILSLVGLVMAANKIVMMRRENGWAPSPMAAVLDVTRDDVTV